MAVDASPAASVMNRLSRIASAPFVLPALAGLVVLALLLTPSARAVGSITYTPILTDSFDAGLGPLRDWTVGETFLRSPGAFVIEPGKTGVLQLSVPVSVTSPALTMVLDGEGHTATRVTCDVAGVTAPIGSVTRMREYRVLLSSCPPGPGPRRVDITVTNVGTPGTDAIAIALDAVEVGTVSVLPAVGTWASSAALILCFAVAVVALAGPGWWSAAAPAALALVVGAGLAGRASGLVASPSPIGGLWNPALQAAAALIAIAAIFGRRTPQVWRAVPALCVVWLTALAVVTRWSYVQASVGGPLWPDVDYVVAVMTHMNHPYDTGTREPFWIWAAWLAQALLGPGFEPQRMMSLLLSAAAIPAVYLFAVGFSRSRWLGVLAAAALATHGFLAGSAAQAHRTEWLVLLYMAVGYFTLVESMPRRRRTIGLSVSAALLVLTSLNGAVLVAGLVPLAWWRGRLHVRNVLVVGAACAVVLLPHVAYNYQQFGTYSWFSARGVPTFYRNYEFMVVKRTGCDGCPTPDELAVSSYSGRPIGMGEYLFGLHSPSEVASRMAEGFHRALVKPGPDLGALLGDESSLRRWLFLAGILIALAGPLRELLLVPVLALNLSAFVVPLGLDPRLFTQPVGVAMVTMMLPVFYSLKLVSRLLESAGGGAVTPPDLATGIAEVIGDTATSMPVPNQRPGAVSLSVIVPVYNERHLVAASVAAVLAIDDPIISQLQVILVDDRSTDSSWTILERLARSDARVIAVRHAVNGGKGAAVQTGLRYCTGDVTIIHDADLEYDPRDIPAIVRPIASEGADAVFGSRYLSAGYRRALRFKHSLMNRGLTLLSNWFTDLDLTDVETCYKAVRTPLFKSIPIRSRDFRLEIELAMKLAKRRARVFEVPIRYLPRTYREGKKIGAKDGVLAIAALVHFWLVDDIYQQDAYGSQILNQLERTRRFNIWMGDTLRPHLGDRVLEIGAGIGTLTEQMIPRDSYTVSDINPVYLAYLRSYVAGKPYLSVRHIDASKAADFAGLDGRFDTVMMVNVLEHVLDEKSTIDNVFRALEPGGRFVVLVPQHPGLYGTLDEALEHRERYTVAGLRRSLESAGFVVDELFDFNRASVPGWWFNGRVLKRRTFSRFQLKVFDTLVPLLRYVDRLLPYGGQSLIAVARRPGQ